ncbi:MAG: hypothetical protein Q7K43_06760 [Candidatus Woesearchaeota archaeon]|nr:hypothetical protein [Candidatus Woesearchaeota archaeon]
MKKNLLGLEIADICSDGTTLYKCDAGLEKAFESVELYTFNPERTKRALPKLREQSVLRSLSEHITKLGVHPVEKPFALSCEICSRWARKYTTSTKDLELAVVVDAYLSRELLRLRVFLGAANKQSVDKTEILNEQLHYCFKEKSRIRFQYSKNNYATIAPTHELFAVLSKINLLIPEVNRIVERRVIRTFNENYTLGRYTH